MELIEEHFEITEEEGRKEGLWEEGNRFHQST
jgi:hypothetical protein